MATVDELMPIIGRLETGGMNDPDAAISRTGAVGRYQIEPSTAEQYGFDPAQLHDPIYNEKVSRTIVADLIKRSGGEGADNARAVLVGYNAGPGRMAQYLQSGHDASILPQETQGYLRKSGLQQPFTQQVNDSYVGKPVDQSAQMPTVWDQISAARAHGFTWDDISQAFNSKREDALKAGFNNGDVNEAFGLPRTYQWQTPGSISAGKQLSDASSLDPNEPFGQRMLDGAHNLFTKAVQGYEAWAEENQANLKAIQADDTKRMQQAIKTGHYLPTFQGPGAAFDMQQVVPGPDVEGPALFAHEMLKAFGWETSEAVKVFGPKFVSSIDATVEHIDGQKKTVEETKDLQKEAKPFADFMDKARKQEEALASPQQVIDASAGLVSDRPLKAFVDTMLPQEREPLGDGMVRMYRGTRPGNHPNGTWFTTNPEKAAEYGDVHYIDVTQDELKKKFFRPFSPESPKGDEYTTVDPDLLARSKKAMVGEGLTGDLAAKAVGRGMVEFGENPSQVATRFQSAPAVFADMVKRVLADEEGAFHAPPEREPYPGGPVPPIPAPTAATIRSTNLPWIGRVVDEVNKFVAPETRSAQAWEASRLMRASNAEAYNATTRMAIYMRQFGRAAATLTNEERLNYLDRWMTGDMEVFKNNDLKVLHDTFAPEIQKMGEELQRRGKIDDLLENYLAGMWRGSVKQNGDMLKNIAGRTPFLKQKVFATYSEGIKAGMIPKTLNPVEVVLKTWAMERQYIARLDYLDAMKKAGLLWDERALPGGKLPPGMAYIDERIAAPPGTPVTLPGGAESFKPARYVATKEVADLFERAFNPSVFRDSTIYSTVRRASMMYISFELSASLFHVSMLTAASLWNGFAMAGLQMSRFLLSPKTAGSFAELRRGVMGLPGSFTKPITYLYRGWRLLNQAYGLRDSGWQIQQRVDAMQQGGYHFGKEDWYNASPQGSFWNSIRGTADWLMGAQRGRMTLGQDIADMFRDQMLEHVHPGVKPTTFQVANATVAVALRMVPRAMDTAMGFLFGQRGMVQMLKAGAADEAMQDALRVNPNMSAGAMRDYASRVSDSIDNRFGMLQYDNAFWNKWIKDVGPLTTVSLGWQAGSFREAIGAFNDLLHMITRGEVQHIGPFKQVSTRVAAIAAFVPTVALYHAIYGYLKGQDVSQWTPYDYFHPPTGGINPDGSPQRAALPFYDNEVYKIIASPITGTATEFFDNGFMNALYSMVNNQDWMGAAIANPNDPEWKQGEDYALYFLKQMEPIVLQNLQEQTPQSAITFWEGLLGVRQANAEFNMPDEYERWVQHQIDKKLRLQQIEQNREEERSRRSSEGEDDNE